MRLKNSREFNSVFGGAPHTKAQAQLAAEIRKAEDQQKRATVRRKSSTRQKSSEPIPFCPLPPAEPANQLYQRLVREWGRYYSGGEIVWELEAVPGSRLRVDAAFVHHRVAIESDGWQFHGKFLKDFKEDRSKALKLSENGWVVIWVSKEMATDLIDETIESIRKVLSHHPRREPPEMIQLPGGWSRVVSQPPGSAHKAAVS